MSTQKPNNDDNQDDEIWKSLFGGTQEDKSQTKKGHTTLQFKAKKSKHGKKVKPSSRSSHSSSRSSKHSSKSNGHRHRRDANYSSQGPSTAERLSQFLCTPKHRARLPPPPLRCKFLKYPHKKDRFTKYCATNLELNYKWEMHHDSLFPLPLDLMDPDYYNPLKNPSDYDDDDEQMLNRMEDERILQLLDDREYDKTAKEETSMPEQEAFLLQTQYLTGGIEYELTESQRKGYDEDDRTRSRNRNKSRDKRRRSSGGNRNSSQSEEGYHRKYNPHSLKNVINTFAEIQNVSHHPTRNVQVDQMFDVFPHEELLENDYTHVQFHNNPSIHTKKCQFMSKYYDERMKMAELATQSALLRCVNKKGLEQERMKSTKQEMEDEEEDNEDEEAHIPDWFSLYATNGKRKASEYDEEDIVKFEWSAEFVPVQSNKKEMRFLVIPKHKGAHSDVFYANFKNRLSLRHRPTDSSQDNAMLGGKKGLSEQDKKFFKQQPMNIKLSVPHYSDTHEY